MWTYLFCTFSSLSFLKLFQERTQCLFIPRVGSPAAAKGLLAAARGGPHRRLRRRTTGEDADFGHGRRTGGQDHGGAPAVFFLPQKVSQKKFQVKKIGWTFFFDFLVDVLFSCLNLNHQVDIFWIQTDDLARCSGAK